jgi:hypothetical protein
MDDNYYDFEIREGQVVLVAVQDPGFPTHTVSEAQEAASIRENVHRLANGRWVLAQYDERNGQWTSGDYKRSFDSGFHGGYAFARDLEEMPSLGIRTYPSKAKATAELKKVAPELFC